MEKMAFYGVCELRDDDKLWLAFQLWNRD
jgi:hypothetical protein